MTLTSITSSPSGAQIYVNGVKGFKTPHMLAPYKIGDVIKLELAGYEPKTKTLTSANIGTTVSFTLKAIVKTGDVKVQSEPSNARIWVDGSDTGKKTPSIITLPTGTHTITLKKDGYQNLMWIETIKEESRILPLKILVPVPLPTTSEVMLSSTPSGASVVISKGEVLPVRYLAPAELTTLKVTLPAGYFHFAFNKTGYETAYKQQRIDAGKSYLIEAALAEKPKIRGAADAFNDMKSAIGKLDFFGALKFFAEMLSLPAVAGLEDSASRDMILGYIGFAPNMPKLTSLDDLGLMGKVYENQWLSNPKDVLKAFKSMPTGEQNYILRYLSNTVKGRSVSSGILSSLTAEGKAGVLGKYLSLSVTPKTILWGLSGIAGLLGAAYGVAFGTEWFAKEGLFELFAIPLSDKMRDYRYKPTPEKAARIEADIKKLEQTVPKAQSLISSVSWLWPFTKASWDEYASGISFQLEQYKTEFEEISKVKPMPEVVETYVRDIIDGDTIAVERADDLLPEYGKTTHARVRIVGINAPEKSPKGEILCSEIEIYKVEAKWTDKSRERLMPLNDKKVTLYIDPKNAMDSYGRVLAKVEYLGTDIGLRQIKEGLACWYKREQNKYIDDNIYKDAAVTAMNNRVGFWEDFARAGLKIKITSEPDRAKIYIDGVYTKHLTPSDQEELKNVIELLTEGKHKIKVEKTGMMAEKELKIKYEDMGELHFKLKTIGLAPAAEIAPEVLPEEEEEALAEKEARPEEVKPEEIPETWAIEQEWALREAFRKIWALTEGTKVMSEKERKELISSFNMYTDDQKKALNLLFQDLTYYEWGRQQLSDDEFVALTKKYKVVV